MSLRDALSLSQNGGLDEKIRNKSKKKQLIQGKLVLGLKKAYRIKTYTKNVAQSGSDSVEKLREM